MGHLVGHKLEGCDQRGSDTEEKVESWKIWFQALSLCVIPERAVR